MLMGNLFSSFDPQVSIIGMNLSLNWISSFLVLVMIPQAYWIMNNQLTLFYKNLFNMIKIELGALFSPLVIPGTSLLFVSFFVFIITCNFAGLFPYVFTPTSHLSMTLSLSLPLWLGTMLWSIVFNFNSMMAHLVPTGTPPALMPVMVIIETVSSIIRPGTLAVRLAANMVAGHLLLTLLGGQGANAPLIVIGSLILLLMLECAVACIQAYVFTILNSLYLNELISTSFNKQMVK
uniref:ATP synthase F0 subunit 6 n=1 Tax=Pseudodiaptomus hessei TaxID=2919416 RepID=UPI002A8341C7|nr:ATP synthase F0 subunit 6 [Pseudodiaptomus hessei]WOH21600.1 ATP synthase F0 subunit 6 [Pseudodiaptomus hessei]